MRHWWVNQNQTYKQEVTGGFMWSPKVKANGQKNPFYETMRNVASGDVVFSFFDTRIKAIGVVTAVAESAPKPNFGAAGKNWGPEGWLVPVEYRELETQIRPKDRIAALRGLLPDKYSPLQSNGNGNQTVYLTEVSPPLATALAAQIGDAYYSALSQLQGLVKPETWSVEEDAIRGRTDIGATLIEQLVNARRGQGIFKANVRLNETCCRITGTTELAHLRASHIKPWRASTDQEKLDGCNGLLLAPHVDHLFDRGYISFADDGRLMVSAKAAPDLLRAWSIEQRIAPRPFKVGQRAFLEYHRTTVFKV